jgi:transposase
MIRATGHSFQKISWRTPPRDMTQELACFFKAFTTFIDSGRQVISLDETGFLTNSMPLRGYGKRGQRLRIAKYHPKRFKVTSIVAISQHNYVATQTFDGNANGALFLKFISRVFADAPNSVVILDNIAFHKSLAVRQIAETHGVHLMFTPAYSPECNPVEHFFSVAKFSVRRDLLNGNITNVNEFVSLVRDALHRITNGHDFTKYFGPRARETCPYNYVSTAFKSGITI